MTSDKVQKVYPYLTIYDFPIPNSESLVIHTRDWLECVPEFSKSFKRWGWNYCVVLMISENKSASIAENYITMRQVSEFYQDEDEARLKLQELKTELDKVAL